MKRLLTLFAIVAAAGSLLSAAAASAAPEDFGLESVEASLSTAQAGAHPDLTFTFSLKQDTSTPPNPFGFHNSHGKVRDVRFDLPPGLVGDPNLLGAGQQCTVEGLVTYNQPGGGCPNGSQVGRTRVFLYQYNIAFLEPVYMMVPPGGDVVARLGFVAGLFPTFVDLRVRSESDYGLVAEVTGAPAAANLIRAETTTWGVPAATVHDTQRCTPAEAFNGCVTSVPRPPSARPLAFMTNPTRCGVPLQMGVSAASWARPDVFDSESFAMPPLVGCGKLPFGPGLEATPTSREAAAPTGLDIAITLPGPDGVDVLEPSQMRDVRIGLPPGLSINPGGADGLGSCSAEQVGLGTRLPSNCPEAAKIAAAEFDVPALPRRMKGAVYLRDPAPGDPYRIWLVADDLGAHVKLPGRLEVDRASGQVTSVVTDVPQVPLREARINVSSGARAPLATPASCGTHQTDWTFTPWSGTAPVSGRSPMTIDRSCANLGAFSPGLAAGTTNVTAGEHSPFFFTITRSDGEQSPSTIELTLPPGLLAKPAGVARCEGGQALAGACPAASRIGLIRSAVGYGSLPLWLPQAGKRPTALYFGGPYRGSPFSAVAVVPAQAGPFDFGDIVVRSRIDVDPDTARATVVSDELPQIVEGVPIAYRTIHAHLDHPGFVLNPTNCDRHRFDSRIRSTSGALAAPEAIFRAHECGEMPFRPRLSFRLFGGTKRGDFPKLRAVLRTRAGDANLGRTVVELPRAQFLEQGHIRTICTRVRFAADDCPKGSVYGRAVARTPLLDEPLEGPVYLRASSNPLPDLVVALRGEVDINVVGRIDSTDAGALRATFESIPDAPVRRFVLTMQGGEKGLLVNARNLCKAAAFADVKMRGQNGKRVNRRRPLEVTCAGR